jgi:glycosyltransferase involved in cell wall biosynthesis
MRLLVVTDRLSARGGADRHLGQLIASAVEAGDRVTVAFGRDDGTSRIMPDVLRVRCRGLTSAVAGRSRLARLASLLDDADVIHAQNVMNPSALKTTAATGRAVVTVQDHRVFCPGAGKTLPDGSPCRRPMAESSCGTCLPDARYRQSVLELTRQRLAAIRRFAAVIVLSGYMAHELATVGIGGAKVIPPWFEVGTPKASPGSSLLIGGRLVPHKGILDGWRAWCEAGQPLPLTVAGVGSLEHELEGAELRGWLEPGPLDAALRDARALLFPARWQEPFGMLGVEALAQGTPAIVADAGGTSDWADVGCIRVPAGDVAAMAEAIRRLARDPSRALALGRAGQASVRDRFSRPRLEPRLRALYQRVTHG